mgnify:CR=1 FL=1
MFLTKKVSSFALLICCMAVVTLSASYADASLPKKSKAEVAKNVPKVLSDNDVNIYRKMFALQRKLDRDGVVALIPKLDDKEILMAMNKTIHNVTHDYENFHFNRAVARIREFTNIIFEKKDILKKKQSLFKKVIETVGKPLAPITPQIVEEILFLMIFFNLSF